MNQKELDEIKAKVESGRPIQRFGVRRLLAEVERLQNAMNKVDSIAVGFVEAGPYEDANAMALHAMTTIEQLSRMPDPPKEE